MSFTRTKPVVVASFVAAVGGGPGVAGHHANSRGDGLVSSRRATVQLGAHSYLFMLITLILLQEKYSGFGETVLTANPNFH